MCYRGDTKVKTEQTQLKIWVIFHLSGRVLKDPLLSFCVVSVTQLSMGDEYWRGSCGSVPPVGQAENREAVLGSTEEDFWSC